MGRNTKAVRRLLLMNRIVIRMVKTWSLMKLFRSTKEHNKTSETSEEMGFVHEYRTLTRRQLKRKLRKLRRKEKRRLRKLG